MEVPENKNDNSISQYEEEAVHKVIQKDLSFLLINIKCTWLASIVVAIVVCNLAIHYLDIKRLYFLQLDILAIQLATKDFFLLSAVECYLLD